MSVRIELMPDPVRRGLPSTGGITCEQEALITVDEGTYEAIWTPSTLELLARSYWEYIRRRTFGIIGVSYRGECPTVLLLGRLKLLSFKPPVFTTSDRKASVEWPIERGLLVSSDGKGQGFLRIGAERVADAKESKPRLVVSSSVSNFYPWVRGTGRFSRLGTWIYSQTQLRIHIAVTRGFLRSLSDLPDEVIRRGVDSQPS